MKSTGRDSAPPDRTGRPWASCSGKNRGSEEEVLLNDITGRSMLGFSAGLVTMAGRGVHAVFSCVEVSSACSGSDRSVVAFIIMGCL